ncbi:MAG: hypothetical protein ACYTAN_08945 [Planctomycetota bacterium]|jgi:hypothetical protein
MKSDKEVWDAKADDYVRRVEGALSGVDHPRKNQVLEDLRNHLEDIYSNLPADRRTPEEFARAIDAMGPPGEYADLLSETPVKPRARAWLRLAVVCLAVALASVILYGAFWADLETRADTLCLLGRGYNAPPFFSVEGFNRIKPGMTDAEVRDLIGYPCNRASWVGRETEVEWQYSGPLFEGVSRCNQFTVFFSRSTNKVIRTEYEKRGMSGWAAPLPWLKAHSGPLTLTRPDGANRVLTASDAAPCLITMDVGAVRGNLQEIFDYYERCAVSVTPGIEEPVIEVLHRYNGTAKAAYAALSPRVYTGWSLPDTPDMIDSRLAVYARGRLYFLPPIFAGIEEEDWREDQRWLVRKLAQEAQ